MKSSRKKNRKARIEREISDFMPVLSLIRTEGKRYGVLFRYKPPNPDEGTIRVYPGRLK